MSIKFHDSAEKFDVLPKVSNKKVYRPSVYLSTKQLPDLKGKKIGDEFYIVQLVKVTGVDSRQNEKEEVMNFDLEIQKTGLTEKEDGKNNIFGNYKNPNSI